MKSNEDILNDMIYKQKVNLIGDIIMSVVYGNKTASQAAKECSEYGISIGAFDRFLKDTRRDVHSKMNDRIMDILIRPENQ
jgi:hypothetical protein